MSPPSESPALRRVARRAPKFVRRRGRAVLTDVYAYSALPLVLRSGAFDREWYEAQTGVTFDSDRQACLHYLETGRRAGHSPHPLFEPSAAEPRTWSKPGIDPLVRHLRGQVPSAGIVHPVMPASWAGIDPATRRPMWLEWARTATPDSPVPTQWSKAGPRPTWAEFRRRAIEVAAECQRETAIRRAPRISAARPRLRPVDLGGGRVTGRAADPAAAPQVSIVMATWNRGPMLRRAISSVIAQTLTDWELIVVDDGSDDDSLLVLEGLSRTEPRLKVVAAPHGGVCRARNTGLHEATGRWIAFLDSDNVWLPDFLANAVDFAETEDVAWAHAAMEIHSEDGVRYRAFEGSRDHMLVANYIDLNVMLVARTAMDRIGGFDETLRRAVDYDLALRLCSIAPPRLIPAIGAVYTEDLESKNRISVAEPVSWNAVVRMRHLVAREAAARPPRVTGRTSVIVPVRNQVTWTAELVGLLQATAPGVEVVLVASTRADHFARILAVGAIGRADVVVVRWPDVLDWSTSIDLGATRATGDTIVAWHAAFKPSEGWLEPLQARLTEPEVAIAQSLAVLPDERISSAGAAFVGTDPFPTPLLDGCPIEDIDGVGDATLPAAYGSVLALSADTFHELGGVDPLFGNAFGEVDLSLRAWERGLGRTVLDVASRVTATDRPRIYGFSPDESASVRILRSRHVAPHGSTQLWAAAGFEEIGRRVTPLPAFESTEPDRGAWPVLRPQVSESDDRLRWAIDIAAPAGAKGLMWGDWHFAQSLAGALRELGQNVHVDRREARTGSHRDYDDVTLVLRGLDEPELRPGSISLMWIISHPELVTEPECRAFDQVFAASLPWSAEVSTRWGFEVQPLLQCTDARLFRPEAGVPDSGAELLFVGTSRKVHRVAVRYAIEAGANPSVYGNDWAGLIDDKYIRGSYVANEDVPELYASASIVLNDHWDDMRSSGFVSNRVFDVLACGGRLISDDVPGLSELFGDAVRTFHTERDMAALLGADRDTTFPALPERLALAERVRSEHSFDARARQLLDTALKIRAERRSSGLG